MELQRLVDALVYDGLLDGVANLAGEFVGSAYAFLQGDVFFFGDQELGAVASELEVFHYGSGNFAVVLVLAEASVGRAFAGVFPPWPFRSLWKKMAALSLVTPRKYSSTSLLMVSKLTFERLLQADWKLWL